MKEVMNQYIPLGIPAGIEGASSFSSATKLSVVRTIDAILAAFCNALLVTFAGSTMPASKEVGWWRFLEFPPWRFSRWWVVDRHRLSGPASCRL
jgi:hypothetical protein